MLQAFRAAALLVFALTTAGTAQGLLGDYGPGSAAMFRSTGPHASEIGVTSEAVLGQNFAVNVRADSRYLATALFVGNTATRGRPVLVGAHELLIHTGNVFWVPTVPLTNGNGQLQFLTPKDETLIGVNLTIQGLLITNQFEIGASNLAVCNIAATAVGPALFGFLTTARHDPMALDDWFNDNSTQNPQPLQAFCNGSRTDSVVVVNLKTGRNLVTGESVEIWVGPSANAATRVATVVQPEGTIAVRVPPGSYIFFQHVGGNATLQLDYDLTGSIPFTSTHIGGNGSFHTYRDPQNRQQPRFLFCNPTNQSVKMRIGWRLKRALARGEELELRIGPSAGQATTRVPITRQQSAMDLTVPAGQYVYLWHKGNASLGVDWEIIKG